MKLLQLSCKSILGNDCSHQLPAQFNSLERFDCSEKQCFYCTSEFLKIYPSTLGNMPVLPSSLLLIQLLCYNFIEDLCSAEVDTDL